MTYQEQLKHPEWQKKRLAVLAQGDFQCEKCYSRDKTLHVHHSLYLKGKKAWEYPDHVYHVFCEDCHKEAHLQKDQFDELISRLGSGRMAMVTGYIKAMLAEDVPVECSFNYLEEFFGAADFLRITEDQVLSAKDNPTNTDLLEHARQIHDTGENTWYGFNRRKVGANG